MVYLIKRCPRPEWHKAPYHPVIICSKKGIAKWEAGDTKDRAWVWMRFSRNLDDGDGFLLTRWNGLDIDYGYVIKNVGDLPDGSHSGFYHPRTDKEPWNLIAGAVWWDDKKMPKSLFNAGVIYPPDNFTQQKVLDLIADDGIQGFGDREIPEYWSKSKENIDGRIQ